MLSSYMRESKQIAVDFDGTITKEDGSLDPVAAVYLHKIHKLGIKLTLWTCRCDERYEYAKSKIVEWGLPISFIEDDNVKPRKLSAIYYIDDRSVPGGKVNWLSTFRYIKKELRKLTEVK